MKNNKNNEWKWNNYLAVIVLVFLIILSIILIPSIIVWHNQNNDLQKERTFHITIAHNLNEQIGNIEGTKPDIQIDLSLNYPRGTLIVDDAVKLSGIAILNESIYDKIYSITIWFQNAQAYPYTLDENNITKGQDLIIWKRQDNNKLIGNTTVMWVLEGTYYPYMTFLLYNNSFYNETIGKQFFGQSTDAAITVYPKSELAQITTNNVQMILAIAFYSLTLAGTGSLIISLWDRKPSTNEENKNSESAKTPTKIDHIDSNRKTNEKINTKQNEKPSKKKNS